MEGKRGAGVRQRGERRGGGSEIRHLLAYRVCERNERNEERQTGVLLAKRQKKIRGETTLSLLHTLSPFSITALASRFPPIRNGRDLPAYRACEKGAK